MEDEPTLYSDDKQRIGKEPKVDIGVHLVCEPTLEI